MGLPPVGPAIPGVWRTSRFPGTIEAMRTTTAIRRQVAAGVLVAILIIARAGRDAAAECTPVVRVAGDPALARPVTALLVRRGLSVSGASQCGTLVALLEGRGEHIWITITDPE